MNENQKGGEVTGGLVNEEALASSKHILVKGQGAALKGAQQWYSPEAMADLAFAVLGNAIPVLDPTAGDGSLLKRFSPANSFGIELDADQIQNAEASYKPIHGDLQDVFPLVYRVSPEFPAVVCNPPFGLKDWKDDTVNDGKPVGSARLTFIYANRILTNDGQIIFICGRDQLDREILPLTEAAGIYFIIDCDDLFEGTSHPCSIAFAVNPMLRDDNVTPPIRKNVPLNMLELLPSAIVAERDRVIGRWNRVASHSYGHKHFEAWEAIHKEHRRRVEKKFGGKGENKREYDVELTGGKVLNVLPSPYASLGLAKQGSLTSVNRLHGKNINYFTTYERDWILLRELESGGFLAIQPKATEAIEELLHDSRRTVCPLYPIKETMRLGYLSDLRFIKCKKTDEDRNFVAGELYPIDTRSQRIVTTVTKMELIKRGENAGEWKEAKYEQERKVLQIIIDQKHRFYDTRLAEDDNNDDIKYIVEHFELPDPGDVGSKYPVETQFYRDLLDQIEEEVLYPNSLKAHNPLRLKQFQKEDLARMMVKKDGMLAWEQGLGKTVAGLTFIEAGHRIGYRDLSLVIVPQDLIPQWQRECKRVLGKEMTLIKTHGQAKQLANDARKGLATGHYITYYEALAVNGTSKSEMLPDIIVETRTEFDRVKGTGKWDDAVMAIKQDDGGWQAASIEQYNDDVLYHTDNAKWVPLRRFEWKPPTDGNQPYRSYKWIGELFTERERTITSKHLCPECRADRKSGWNGKFCRAENVQGQECGYSHYLHRVKPMGSLLSTAFKHGTVIVDEGTMIQGDYSERSKVIRGISGGRKLLMSGTPIKNYIPQAFWPLWWCLGNNSKRFPYPYTGKGDFENNHAVIQWAIVGGKKATRKVLPEVTNLSQLWRLLASSIIRRRKEETGENLVARTFHPIVTPLGETQREQIEKWTKDFARFFAEKYPDAPVVKAGAHEVMAPMLGLGQKLDFGATIPEGDPDFEWTGVEGVSNFTPANLRALEITMALVKQGRKVLLGSQWLATVPWFCERLAEKGINTDNLLDASGTTATPAKRAKAVQRFQEGDTQVLVVGIQSIRLGHNLDKASAAVVNGLPWDWESFDQFVARIHRLTSNEAVDVYVMVPGTKTNTGYPTITGRKWDILRQKGDAASLALDGRLIEKREAEVSESDVVQQMIESGIPIVGDEVPESEIETMWGEIKHIEHYEPAPYVLHCDLTTPIENNHWEVFVEVIGDFRNGQKAICSPAVETALAAVDAYRDGLEVQDESEPNPDQLALVADDTNSSTPPPITDSGFGVGGPGGAKEAATGYGPEPAPAVNDDAEEWATPADPTPASDPRTWLVGFGDNFDSINALMEEGDTLYEIQPFAGNAEGVNKTIALICSSEPENAAVRLKRAGMGGMIFRQEIDARQQILDLRERFPATVAPPVVTSEEFEDQLLAFVGLD